MLPIAELHVHIEGTLEAELVVDLAARNGVSLASTDPEVLRRQYRFANLQEFLDVYYANLRVMKTADDFHDLAAAYYRRAHAAGVRHAELFFDPQTHSGNGVPVEAVLDGLGAARAEAERDLGITGGLILCFLRDQGPEAALETLTGALHRRDDLLGVGLDSAEVGFPPSLFREVFARAKGEGLHRVAHAGEEGGPDYVWEALDLLDVERIDHGNRAMEDPDLVTRLRNDGIPLTICPLSNLALHTAPPRLGDHPLPAMLEAGLMVSINSDDPAYFGGYVDDNFDAVTRALDLSPKIVKSLAANSIVSSFADDARKRELLALVDAAE
ncbi:MAG: adenosine deaminase [Frondihabitans sp.]|nr:adenosine deaminase [Frondihabitans sp.]